MHDHTHEHTHTHTQAHSHESRGHRHVHSEEEKKAVLNRLSRAIGHLESVKRMVERDEDCSEVLIQLSAVRNAINNTGKVIMKNHISHCIRDRSFHQVTDGTMEAAALNGALSIGRSARTANGARAANGTRAANGAHAAIGTEVYIWKTDFPGAGCCWGKRQ